MAVALLVEAAVVFMQVRTRVSAPFWYDEQWRAYHLSPTKGFLRDPQHINTAVAAGWVAIERASVLAFGNNEWALRLPEALALAAIGWPTWRVARHWLGVTASAIIAAAVVASGPLLSYATQLKPYCIEALCCVVALLLWLEATDPDRRSTQARFAMYAGIGLCMLVATPLVFVVVPLLAIDLARGLRSRGRGELLRWVGPAVIAGGMALAHLIWFVLPQSRSANFNEWNLEFLPRSGRLGWVTAQLGTFVPNLVTNGLPLPGDVLVALDVLLVGGLAAGTAFALVDARARPLLAALYGALAMELVAAVPRLWPFGFVRVNLFLVPLFYLLAGIGMARLGGLAAGWARRRHAAARAGGVAGLVLVLTASAAGGWGVARASGAVAGRMRALDQQQRHAWGYGMRTVVEQARSQAGPRDTAIVVGAMGVKGWSYYMWSYQGWSGQVRAGSPIPPDRTVVGDPPQRSSVMEFLAAHRDARRVFLMAMINARPGWKAAIFGPLVAAGYRQLQTSKAAVTGMLMVWERQATVAG